MKIGQGKRIEALERALNARGGILLLWPDGELYRSPYAVYSPAQLPDLERRYGVVLIFEEHRP